MKHALLSLLALSSPLASAEYECPEVPKATDVLSADQKKILEAVMKPGSATYCSGYEPGNSAQQAAKLLQAKQICEKGMAEHLKKLRPELDKKIAELKASGDFVKIRQAETWENSLDEMENGGSKLLFVDGGKASFDQPLKLQNGAVPSIQAKVDGMTSIGKENMFIPVLVDVQYPACSTEQIADDTKPVKPVLKLDTLPPADNYFSTNHPELTDLGKKLIAARVDEICENFTRGLDFGVNKRIVIVTSADMFSSPYANKVGTGNRALSHDRGAAMKEELLAQFAARPDCKRPGGKPALDGIDVSIDYLGEHGDGTSGPSPYLDPLPADLPKYAKRFAKGNAELEAKIISMYEKRPKDVMIGLNSDGTPRFAYKGKSEEDFRAWKDLAFKTLATYRKAHIAVPDMIAFKGGKISSQMEIGKSVSRMGASGQSGTGENGGKPVPLYPRLSIAGCRVVHNVSYRKNLTQALTTENFGQELAMLIEAREKLAKGEKLVAGSQVAKTHERWGESLKSVSTEDLRKQQKAVNAKKAGGKTADGYQGIQENPFASLAEFNSMGSLVPKSEIVELQKELDSKKDMLATPPCAVARTVKPAEPTKTGGTAKDPKKPGTTSKDAN